MLKTLRGEIVNRVVMALRACIAILRSGRLPAELSAQLAPPQPAVPQPPAPPQQEKATDGALRILGILQRDARLLDFLMEDISAYPDEQVGAAVRGLHQDCRRSLERYLRLAPVLDGVEGTYVRLDAAAEPGAVRLLGNVPLGAKAEGGILRHKGWRATRIVLPEPAAGEDPAVLAPAEIEVE